MGGNAAEYGYTGRKDAKAGSIDIRRREYRPKYAMKDVLI